MDTKVLFIVKMRAIHDGTPYSYTLSSGLFNSARFVVDMLNRKGIEAKLVEVVDNNQIDAEVTNYQPTHCIIEAYWVVPAKFDILCNLHPDVQFIIRNHSEMAFLSNEGIAMEWSIDYLRNPDLILAANSEYMTEEMRFIASQVFTDMPYCEIERRIVYLPNSYTLTKGKDTPPRERDSSDEWIDVGCFGAIRPMKNQLLQAVAALRFADEMEMLLAFHISVGRVETNGSPVLKNLRKLFADLPQHKLVEHTWMNHDDFVAVVRQMDIGMQVSFTETFNIVSADFANNNVPIVVSPQIRWISDSVKADPNDLDDIVRKMHHAWLIGNDLSFFNRNKGLLRRFVRKSTAVWLDYFG